MNKFTEGQTIILRGITKKGKERIKRWGEKWIVNIISGPDVGIVASGDDTECEDLLPESFRWLTTDFEIVKQS